MLDILGIRFRNIDFLYLLLLVPFVVFLWRLALCRKRRFQQSVFERNLSRSKRKLTSHISRVGVGFWKQAGYTLILVALGLALAQPQLLREKFAEEHTGIDTVLVLDNSFSMMAEDIVPSRMGKAKEVIREFIVQKRPGDRIGLVIFAENSLILSYLTRDPENLLFYMDYTEPQYGTNIGRAITSGLRVFEKEDEISSQSGQPKVDNQRIMILVSDGEDTGHELEPALTAASKADIKVSCIGVGSRRSVPIPLGSSGKGIRQYLKDEGTQVYTRFNDISLREIANRTGGRFYRSFVGYELAHAFDDIMKKEMQVKNVKVTTQYEDTYHYFLIGSLGLFLALLTVDRQ